MQNPTPSLLLRRLADELLSQGEAVRDLHALVESGPVSVSAAQNIDIVSQHLDEIAGVLQRLADETPQDAAPASEGVLEPVALSALRNRLAGTKDEDAAAGDLDLF